MEFFVGSNPYTITNPTLYNILQEAKRRNKSFNKPSDEYDNEDEGDEMGDGYPNDYQDEEEKDEEESVPPKTRKAKKTKERRKNINKVKKMLRSYERPSDEETDNFSRRELMKESIKPESMFQIRQRLLESRSKPRRIIKQSLRQIIHDRWTY
jgi:hypothetical protein